MTGRCSCQRHGSLYAVCVVFVVFMTRSTFAEYKYQLHTSAKLDWNEANNLCRSVGGSLPYIPDASEQAAVNGVRAGFPDGSNSLVWLVCVSIGLWHDQTRLGLTSHVCSNKWTSGGPVTYDNTEGYILVSLIWRVLYETNILIGQRVVLTNLPCKYKLCNVTQWQMEGSNVFVCYKVDVVIWV